MNEIKSLLFRLSVKLHRLTKKDFQIVRRHVNGGNAYLAWLDKDCESWWIIDENKYDVL